MRRPLIALLLLGAALLGAGGAAAETAECRALLKQREAECQAIAEKRTSVCPEGQAAADPAQAAECGRLSSQLKDLCTRKPCGAAAKKAKKKKGKPKRPATKRPPAKSG